jgi:hypothetical protein
LKRIFLILILIMLIALPLTADAAKKNVRLSQGADDTFELFQSVTTDLGSIVTLDTELRDDHATNKALIDELLFKVAFLVHRDQNRSIDGTSPVFAIDTNFDVKNTETATFIAAGVPYTLTDNTSCDTGTAKTLTASKWGAFVIDATNATTLTCTWAASEYASEALALAAARAVAFATGKARLGIVAVLAHASGFTAGTDALTTGSGGNVATTTNYYQFFDLVPITSTTSAATLSAPAVTLGTTSD